jgi:hypothetical protein
LPSTSTSAPAAFAAAMQRSNFTRAPSVAIGPAKLLASSGWPYFKDATTPRSASQIAPAARCALSGVDSQVANRPLTSAAARRPLTISADKKLLSTNSPSDRPSCSLRRGMIAVCGIGRPSG